MHKTFTIAGMHRSGTSLMANWFHNSNAFLGFDLLDAASSNKKGHFEDVEFLELHKKDLRDKGYHETGLLIEKEKDWFFNDENRSIASSIIDKRSSFEFWGWKEPRTALYLEQWKKLIPHLKVISVYREPTLVIDSLYRRLKRNKWYYTRNPITRLKWWVDIDHNPRKWHHKFSAVYTHYNKKIIDFHKEHPKDSILINIEDLLTGEEKIRIEIESFLSQNLNFVPFSTVYEKQLMKGKTDPLNLPEIESSIEIFGLMEDLKV
ncbi:Sulfotransferase family protein [Ekhidna lutea]|uniref:Sulfotransferase family protein n=1 Tax=Ekhidna lutea TaxID=447679 RepID=A0A239J9D0_EKHLU|nr:sulfotransferase [Ekhidna lutea]SNT02098.1 Sulfotransferase family protein [Ekhidna lutea]